VYFPRVLLPLASVSVPIADFLPAFLVLVGLMVWYSVWPSLALLLAPFFLAMALIAALGVGLGLSALNARYRDVPYAIPFLIQIDILLLYVVVLFASAVKQFFDPAEQSVLPDVASEEELSAANAFLSISSFGSTAIGFAAAGFLASTGNINLAFYVDGVTFVLSAVCIFFVRIAPLVVDETTSVGAVVTVPFEFVVYLIVPPAGR
jgi:hypothetical protein